VCGRAIPETRGAPHTKARESVMAVMDWLSQNRNLEERWFTGGGGDVQSDVGGRGHAVMWAAGAATWVR
jgi:hypothetical protein